MDTARILVTGANGLVGRALVERLARDGVPVRAAVRAGRIPLGAVLDVAAAMDLEEACDWMPALAGVGRIVHLAARVHRPKGGSAGEEAAYRRINVEATLRLARQAAAAGVTRFVYVSSISVNGVSTPPGAPFTAESAANPQDPYGRSKAAAEAGLNELSRRTAMEVVIIRPPLVYGPGVKANFLAMMRWLNRGIPLPLGSVRNFRSLVGVGNLVDLISLSLRHPAAANQTFLVSDGRDVSVPELLRMLGRAMGRPARLLPIPPGMLRSAAAVLGRRDLSRRLCDSLQIDLAKTRHLLDWHPPVTLEEELRRTAEHYLRSTA